MTFRLSPRNPGLWWLVLPFAALILVETGLAVFSFNTLSIVRAYIQGESHWSKGQKDAIYYLSRYADSGDPEDFQRYKQAIAIPLGDLAARRALDETPADLKTASAGLLRGANDPEDVPGIIWLYQNFRNVSYLRKSIELWRATDDSLQEIVEVAARIDKVVAGGDQARRDATILFQTQIDAINQRLTPKAIAFSASLSEGSRAIRVALIALNVAAAFLLILLMVLHTRKLLRQRQIFEAALKAEKERAQITLASIGEAVIATDAEGRIEYLNLAAERLIGQSAADTTGGSVAALIRMTDEDRSVPLHGAEASGLATVNSKHRLLSRWDGTMVPVTMVRTELGTGNDSSGAVYVLHDRTAELDFISRLAWQATHDALTGLANRREFERRLQAAIDHLADGKPGTSHCLMFLDIDQFKVVNDTCGHAAGDELLRQATGILQRELRRDDLIARLGGDEFAILVESCDLAGAVELAERLRSAMQSASFEWNDRAFSITVSIGVVPVAHADTTLEETLRVADMACYMAKEKGRNRVEVHQASDAELLKRFSEMNWVQQIRRALDEDRFRLYAQDILALSAAAETGRYVELLLRLQDEDGQIVTPDKFIPPAERYGLMPMIDRWVVHSAFRTIASHLANPGAKPIARCAINLSGASFGDADFVEYLREQLEFYCIEPSMICFEITETSAIANLASARRFIIDLSKLGCRFSLDDFGAGMSSFVYLKHLPVDCIKIDGSFVKDMLTDRIDRAMVEMIDRVGKLMGITTIAEFVENEDIIAALREIGVDYAQGYAIGKPQPFEVRGAERKNPPANAVA